MREIRQSGSEGGARFNPSFLPLLNRLRQIEQEVLAAGREWTRALLEKRLQAECLAVAMVSPQTGEELENTRWMRGALKRRLQLSAVG